MKFTKPSVAIGVAGLLLLAADVLQAEGRDGSLTYRYFHAEEANGRVLSMMPVPADPVPRWARDVSQESHDWPAKPDDKPLFAEPIPFVLAPADQGERFGRHHHQPSITWLPNGDLLAIWYSTGSEVGHGVDRAGQSPTPGRGIMGSVERVLQGAEPQHAPYFPHIGECISAGFSRRSGS